MAGLVEHGFFVGLTSKANVTSDSDELKTVEGVALEVLVVWHVQPRIAPRTGEGEPNCLI